MANYSSNKPQNDFKKATPNGRNSKIDISKPPNIFNFPIFLYNRRTFRRFWNSLCKPFPLHFCVFNGCQVGRSRECIQTFFMLYFSGCFNQDNIFLKD